MAVAWGEIGPAVAGGLTTGALIWRGFRTLSKKLDHVEKIPVIKSQVDTIATRVDDPHATNIATAKALAAHMVDEARATEADRRERDARQVALDKRLQHMDGALVRIGGYVPPMMEDG